MFTKKNIRLLVAIPCLNESETISELIEAIPRDIASVDSVDVLVVDDGSTDSTSDKAKKSGALVVQHARNLGVGAAFQTAVNFAVEKQYDVMVNIDGDGQFDPADIRKLVAPILIGDADMCTASRFINNGPIDNMPKVKQIGNYMMSYLISRLVKEKYYDVSCGFRSYSREALLHLNLHGAFTYTQETFLNFAAKRLKIVEIPIVVKYFKTRKSRVANSIVKYAINTSKIIFRTYRDYNPLRFFWGLSGLLALPGAILGIIFFVHFFLTGTFKGYLFAGFLSAFLMVMATVFVVIGIVADMLDRIRVNQERVLYFLKKNTYTDEG